MTTNTAALADAYAALKFEEDKIKARVSELRKEIIDAANGDKQIVGDVCIVSLIQKKGATTLDKDAALALLRSLGATPEQIAGLTKTGEPTTSLQVKAKLELAA